MKRYRLTVIFAAVLMLAALTFLASCAKGPVDPDTVKASLTSKDKIQVTVCPDPDLLERYKGESELYLFALRPGQSLDDANYQGGGVSPLAKKKAADRLDFDFSLTENGNASLLTCRFVGAFVDSGSNRFVQATSFPAYVSNPELLGEGNRPERNDPASMKGLAPAEDTDAVLLGVSHAIIDIKLDEYLTFDGNGAESYIYNGRSYFISPSAISALDKRVRFLTDSGVKVYFRFSLGKSEEELTGALALLACPGTKKGSDSYMINFASPEGAACAAGFFDYIAARYTDSSKGVGFCSDFIAGIGANTPSVNGDCGNLGNKYFAAYYDLVRTLYTSLVSHCGNGQVYITIDHRLKKAGGASPDMKGSEFLSEFAAYSSATGDFPWGVAANIRATSVDPDRIWYDDSGNGDYLTPSNLRALTVDIMPTEKMLCGGGMRKIIIDGFSVALSESKDPTADEINQAASYAYAYYCALETKSISAFIYSSHIDAGDRKSGLFTSDESGKPLEPRNRIRTMMKYIDTDYPIGGLIGGAIEGGKWDSLYENNRAAAAVNRMTLSEAAGVVEKAADKTVEETVKVNYDASSVFDFTSAGDTLGFYAVGGESFASLSSGLLVSVKRTSPAQSVIVFNGDVDASLVSGDSIIFIMKLSSPAKVTLRLEQKRDDGSLAIYESPVSAIAGEQAYAFDVSEYRKAGLNKNSLALRLSVEPTGESEDATELKITGIFAAKEYRNTVLIVVLAVLGAAALIAVITIFVIWFRKNYTVEIGNVKKRTGDKGKGKKKPADDDDEDMKVRPVPKKPQGKDDRR